VFSVAQSPQQIGLAIQFRERSFQKIPYTNGHPATGIEIAVWLNRNKVIAGAAMIRSPASHEELERPPHKNLGPTKAPHGFVMCPIHDLEEIFGFLWGKTQRGGTCSISWWDETVGPDAARP
jgi:hypothetical protein